MPNLRSAQLVGAILALSSAALIGAHLAFAQQAGNSTGNATNTAPTNATTSAPSGPTNGTYNDVIGTCVVEGAGNFHICNSLTGAQQAGMATVAGLVALSIGLGVAGLRYRYPKT